MMPVSPVIPGVERMEHVYAKDQPQYLPLPALPNPDGNGICTRWRLSWAERWRIFRTGNLYLEVLTFSQKLQPLKPSTLPPDWSQS